MVAVPGMGDLRSTYRDVVPPLVAAGYRVAVTDLRGHGESDTTFRRHGDDVTGADVLALIAELGGPAVIIGNSMGAGAAAWAAAENPDAVAGLILLGPFLRNPSDVAGGSLGRSGRVPRPVPASVGRRSLGELFHQPAQPRHPLALA